MSNPDTQAKGRSGPVVIELEETEDNLPRPEVAAPVVAHDLTAPTAMERAVRSVARPRSRIATLFWGALGALVSLVVSVAFYDFVTNLLARNAVLGQVALVILGLLGLAATIIALREWAALARLRRVSGLQDDIRSARDRGDLKAAHAALGRLTRLYRGRDDLDWGLARLAERQGDVLDAPALLDLAEDTLMTPLDAAARAEVEAAARQVATITAIVPLALADVVTALVANLRMIRRIAEAYGGRAGFFGSWRLFRSVMVHLVATGAVAVGDDLIGSVLGGGALSKISRRFGEGTINGALTARVGIAAIEVCRPMPFGTQKRPGVTETVRRALAGLFSRNGGKD